MLLVVLAIIIFGGCANVSYTRKVDKDGSVLDTLQIELQVQTLQTAGINVEDLLEKIEDDLTLYFFNNISTYMASVVMTTPTLANANLTHEQKEYIISNIVLKTVKTESSIEASIHYKTASVFESYYAWLKQMVEEPTEEQADSVKVERGLFLHKIVQVSDSAFGNVNEPGTSQDIYNEYLDFVEGYGEFSIDNVSFSQSYITRDYKLKSNADYYMVFDQMGYHTWQVNPNGGTELKFFKFVPNVITWYILAAAVSVVVVIIIFWVAANKQRDIYKQIVGIE